MRECAIAVSGGGLRGEDVVVDRQLATGTRRQERSHPFESRSRGRPVDQGRGHDGAGVDQRIVRAAGVGFEADRVERLAARLEPHVSVHLVEAEFGDRQGVDERLRDRLDGELPIAVASGMDPAVHAHQCRAEPVRIDGGEFGDVRSDLARDVRPVPLDDRGKCIADRVGDTSAAECVAHPRRPTGRA